MDYSLNIGEWNSVFAVPSSVVDKYIKVAGEKPLKLLLYLLRHGGKEISEEKLKSELGFLEKGELEDAALFWIQRGIISYSGGEGKKSLVCKKEKKAEEIKKQEAAEIDEKAAESVKEKPRFEVITSGEIARRIKEDPEVKMLFDEAEKLYSRPLKQRERETLISLTDHYGLSGGAALMLLQYCFKNEKAKPAYILALAEDWSKEEIFSIESANEKILSLEKFSGLCERLRSEMELKTRLTSKMKGFIRVWSAEWGFGEEMIMLGFEKTVDKIGEWKPEYENKILEGWKNAGIFTAEAVKKAEEQRKNSSEKPKQKKEKQKGNSSFDVDDVMSNILNRYDRK